MVEIKKCWVCKLCKSIVEREKRFEHLKEQHSPVEFFDFVEVIMDEWEK